MRFGKNVAAPCWTSGCHTCNQYTDMKIDLDRVSITLEGNLLTETDQEAKLRLVAETAQEVWN